MPVAALFGSSLAAPGDNCCLMAQELGAGLARLGYTLKTGGYSGVMEAASRGARNAGGDVLGITVETLAGRRRPNAHLTREIREADLLSRLRTLVAGTDLFFALESGGPGPLNEVFVVWAMNILGELSGRPLVLVGSGWNELLAMLRSHFAISDALMTGITIVPDVTAALDFAAELLRRRITPG